jgi:hypothetical protein
MLESIYKNYIISTHYRFLSSLSLPRHMVTSSAFNPPSRPNPIPMSRHPNQSAPQSRRVFKSAACPLTSPPTSTISPSHYGTAAPPSRLPGDASIKGPHRTKRGGGTVGGANQASRTWWTRRPHDNRRGKNLQPALGGGGDWACHANGRRAPPPPPPLTCRLSPNPASRRRLPPTHAAPSHPASTPAAMLRCRGKEG